MKAKAWCMILHSRNKGTLPEIEMKPLVLCGDCKYWKDNGENSTHWLPCQEMSVPQDWFCASGEAKDGGETNADGETPLSR